jgi:hypothetical protein
MRAALGSDLALLADPIKLKAMFKAECMSARVDPPMSEMYGELMFGGPGYQNSTGPMPWNQTLLVCRDNHGDAERVFKCGPTILQARQMSNAANTLALRSWDSGRRGSCSGMLVNNSSALLLA